MTDVEKLTRDVILPLLKPFKQGVFLDLDGEPYALLVEVVVVRVQPLYDHDGKITGVVPYLLCKHLGYEEDEASVKMIHGAEWSTDGDILTMTSYNDVHQWRLTPATEREQARIKAWRRKAGDTSGVDAYLLEEWKFMATGWTPPEMNEEEEEDELPETVDL